MQTWKPKNYNEDDCKGTPILISVSPGGFVKLTGKLPNGEIDTGMFFPGDMVLDGVMPTEYRVQWFPAKGKRKSSAPNSFKVDGPKRVEFVFIEDIPLPVDPGGAFGEPDKMEMGEKIDEIYKVICG